MLATPQWSCCIKGNKLSHNNKNQGARMLRVNTCRREFAPMDRQHSAFYCSGSTTTEIFCSGFFSFGIGLTMRQTSFQSHK